VIIPGNKTGLSESRDGESPEQANRDQVLGTRLPDKGSAREDHC
jgi:hypothetical protein